MREGGGGGGGLCPLQWGTGLNGRPSATPSPRHGGACKTCGPAPAPRPRVPGSPKFRWNALPPLPCSQDNDVPLGRLVAPLAELPEAAAMQALRDPLLPVDVEGDRQYFLSLRYGRVEEAATLHALLRGQLEGQRLRADEEPR